MNTEETKSDDSNAIKRGNSEKSKHLEADLTNSPKTNQQNVIPNLTSNNSPKKRNGSDVSPTKSKSRRKNEARRRSANLKKQSASNEQSEKCDQKPESSNSPVPIQDIVQDTNKSVEVVEQSGPLLPSKSPVEHNETTTTTEADRASKIRHGRHSESGREKSKEYKELKDQLKNQSAQIQSLIEQVKQQMGKIKELDKALLSTTRTCNQLEKLLQQELSSRTRLESDNASLEQTITRLKTQLDAHEKNKSNNDELVRVLNATLMERETEVSILKLKLTRIQTNPSSTLALDSLSNASPKKNDAYLSFANTGRSNSEFDRNSYLRSSKIAEAASVRAASRGSIDKNASIWATVPEELTPSKRPLMLERNVDLIYGDSPYSPFSHVSPIASNETPKPFTRDRLYKTLPRSMKSPTQELDNGASDKMQVDQTNSTVAKNQQQQQCQITNLDDSNSTNRSSGDKTSSFVSSDDVVKPSTIIPQDNSTNSSSQQVTTSNNMHFNIATATNQSNKIYTDTSHYSTISRTSVNPTEQEKQRKTDDKSSEGPPSLPPRTPSTPVRISTGLKKIFDKFRRSDSSTQSKNDLSSTPPTPVASPFKRGATRSTLIGVPQDIRAQMSPKRQAMTFQTDKPFSEWDTDMLVEWLTMIGLSMYTAQCRRWVKCGAHIMNATPAEVDRGLGITNHLHRKKLRLAISELNGDCDKVTKAAAKLDYLWVARWLDDIGLPQYKESFINARVDGRVLNYLTIEDLVSMGVKSVLHHASIRCGIRVLRSINFNLTSLKRRATADELEQMNLMRQQLNSNSTNSAGLPSKNEPTNVTSSLSDVPLWTCHRVMEWLRLIDFAEFAPNLRGSGVHGGLIVYEHGFNIDTMYSILTIPTSRTLLRRHLSTFFKQLVGDELTQKKQQHKEQSPDQQLNPLAEIKTAKKSQLWFTKRKSSKVGQDDLDEYLCPMYPVEPQINESKGRSKGELTHLVREEKQLSRIPESINV